MIDFTATTADLFKFKIKITAQTKNDGEINCVEIMVPLKYLSKFWRTLKMLLINCKVEIVLNYFTITETNLYVPIVTLSTQVNAKLLPQLKSDLKRTISWNKYLSKPEL